MMTMSECACSVAMASTRNNSSLWVRYTNWYCDAAVLQKSRMASISDGLIWRLGKEEAITIVNEKRNRRERRSMSDSSTMTFTAW